MHDRSCELNATASRRYYLVAIAFAATLFSNTLPQVAAQSQTRMEDIDRVRGVVINSVTHEPISRALVLSPDNSFAAMTDDRGHFEFTFTPVQPERTTTFDASVPQPNQSFQDPTPSRPSTALATRPGFPNVPLDVFEVRSNRPSLLIARKVGFLSPDIPLDISDVNSTAQVFTISLMPEARIVGHVILPGSDGSDKMQVALYRRNVREGQEHWDLTANAAARADGEFRLAELPPGSYKLLTLEQLDCDPLTFDPRGQLFGYPPLYYPSASDFDTAAIIRLAPGETFQPT